MSYKIVVTCLAAWLGIALLGAMFDGALLYLDASGVQGVVDTSGSAINTVLNGQVVNFVPFPLTHFEVPMPNPGYFKAIGELGLFNFSFFEGYYILVRWILLLMITGPIGYKFLELTLPGFLYMVGSAASAIASRLGFPWA